MNAANTPSAGEEPDDLVTALLTASRVLVGVSARSLAGVEDTVTLTQFRTLVVLSVSGSTTLVRLAARLGVNTSTAQRSVERLVGAGLVLREANTRNRREVVIDLTDAGAALVAAVTRRRRAAIAAIAAAMPATHRRHLVAALVAFSRAADEPSAASTAAGELGW